MKYILMMNTMRAGKPGFPGWSKGDIQKHVAFMMRVNRELRESGELVSLSAAPGAGGAPLKMPIEVRPILGGPPPEFA